MPTRCVSRTVQAVTSDLAGLHCCLCCLWPCTSSSSHLFAEFDVELLPALHINPCQVQLQPCRHFRTKSKTVLKDNSSRDNTTTGTSAGLQRHDNTLQQYHKQDKRPTGQQIWQQQQQHDQSSMQDPPSGDKQLWQQQQRRQWQHHQQQDYEPHQTSSSSVNMGLDFRCSARQHSLRRNPQNRHDDTGRSWSATHAEGHGWGQQQQQFLQDRLAQDKRNALQHQQQSRGNVDARSSNSAKGAMAAAVGGTGAVWQAVQHKNNGWSSSGDSNSITQRLQRADNSKTPVELALHSPAGTAITPAVLTQAVSSVGSLTELQQLLTKHKDSLQQIHVCAAYKAVVRLSPGGLKPSDSSISSNSCSTNEGGVALAIMRQLSSRMLQQIRVARPWDLAQAAWACSKLQYLDTRLLDSIAQQAERKAIILLPQDIAQLASAYARLDYKRPRLMQLLQQQALRQATAFKPWSLIHTAWALQVAGTDPKPLVQKLAGQLGPSQLQGLQPLDVATLLWLMAAHNVREEALLAAVAKHFTCEIANFSPAAVAQVLISLAGLDFEDTTLAETAACVVLQELQQQLETQQDMHHQQQVSQHCYGPKQVAHAVFALARFGQGSPQLLDAAAAAFVRSPGGYSPQLLCMLCWAFLPTGYLPPADFASKWVEQCLMRLPKFTADQTASIIRGLCPMKAWQSAPDAEQLLTAACTQLSQHLQHISTPVLAKLIRTVSKQQRANALLQCKVAQSSTAEAAGTQQQGQRSDTMLELLQQCGQEWLQEWRLTQADQQQNAAVQLALQTAGLSDLATAAALKAPPTSVAQQISLQQQQEELSAGSSSTIESRQTAAIAGTSKQKQLPNAGTANSWLDSFVATADDKHQEQQL